MSERESFLLKIKDLPMGIHDFNYVLNESFFDIMEFEEGISGDVLAKIEVDKQPSLINIEAVLNGEIQVPCDRCLDAMPLPVASDQTFVLKTDEAGNLLNIEEFDFQFEGDAIDLAVFFYEEIMLSIPIQKTHEEGHCNEEMMRILARYTKQEIEEKNTETDPRWAALKDMLKDI